MTNVNKVTIGRLSIVSKVFPYLTLIIITSAESHVHSQIEKFS